MRVEPAEYFLMPFQSMMPRVRVGNTYRRERKDVRIAWLEYPVVLVGEDDESARNIASRNEEQKI